VAHLSHAHRLAAGLHPPPSLAQPFAAVQAAWRFYSNDRIALPQLAAPLIECARADVSTACAAWLLVVLDWSNLHLCRQDSRLDRVELAHRKDLGYELLSALAVGDREGWPLAPLCLDLRASDGIHSTRADRLLTPPSALDGLEPVMAHVESLSLGKPAVFIIDREADSVGHYRQWSAMGRRFLVRADDQGRVLYQGGHQPLGQVADTLKRRGVFQYARPVQFKGRPARQFVAETTVVLDRPARTHRVDPKTGQAKHKNIGGPPLPLRLVVSEVRDHRGGVLGRWLLLTNLPASVEMATVAVWYYWRWEIESYHKLLKGAGQQVEAWLQENAVTFSRRLVVAAMAGVIVWRLARDNSASAAEMRDVLVRLSGRQMKRGKNQRSFTEPALLAGLGVLMSMLGYLREHDLDDLRRLTEAVLPGLVRPISRLDDG
jgi:hypothetical protein